MWAKLCKDFRSGFRGTFSGSRGLVLLPILAGIVVFTALAAGMAYMISSSSYDEVGLNYGSRAVYMAEAGYRYADPYVNACAGDSSCLQSLVSTLNNQTFTLSNGDQFSLQASYSSSTNQFTLVSTGMINPGKGILQSTHTSTFVINTSAAAVPQFTDQFENGLGNWNILKGTTAKLKPPPGNSSDLGLIDQDQQFQAAILPGLVPPAGSNGLRSYSAQVKFWLAPGPQNSYMPGISFRLSEDASGNYDQYGVSYYRYIGDQTIIPSVFTSTLAENDLYVVLWKNVGGTYTILGYKDVTNDPDQVDSGGQLAEWATLLVNVQEKFQTDSNGNYIYSNGNIVTTNRITVYIASMTGTSSGVTPAYAAYPRDTINWNFGSGTSFEPVQWDPVPGTCASWSPGAAQKLGDLVTPNPTPASPDNLDYYECTVGGTTGTAQPAWPTTSLGATVADGTVVWALSNSIFDSSLPSAGLDTSIGEVGLNLFQSPNAGGVYFDDFSVEGTATPNPVIEY